MQETPALMYLVLAAESLATAALELPKNLAPDMLKTFALAPEFLKNLPLELPKNLAPDLLKILALAPEFLQNLTLEQPNSLIPELLGRLAPELLKRTEALATLAHEVYADIVVMLGPGLDVEALYTSVRTAVVEGLAQNEGEAQRRIAAAARRAAVRGVLKTVVEAVVTVSVVRAGTYAPGIMFILSALGAGGTIAVTLDQYINRKIVDERVKAKL